VDTLDVCRGNLFGDRAAGRGRWTSSMSCTPVRFYVAKYSASAAETWARNKGTTDAEIEAARHCLKDSPVQAVTNVTTTVR
jgi:hypothetical protein